MNHKTNRFFELDAFRGLAAIMVMLFHYTMRKVHPNYEILRIGCTGVDLFFIISGFVIFLSVNYSKSWYRFLLNRFVRLYPTYWVCVSITALLITYINFNNTVYLKSLFTQYLANLTMFQAPMGYRNIDGPYWTLYLEMQFYGLIAILVATKSIGNIKTICSVAIICIFAYVSFLHFGFWEKENNKIIGHFQVLVYLPMFIAGIGFYHLKDCPKNLHWNGIVIFCFVSQLLFFRFGGRASGYIGIEKYFGALFCYFLMFYLFILGKMAFVVNKFTLFMGSISYPFYLIHQFLGINFLIPTLCNNYHLSFELSALVAVATSISLAYFISTFIEIPFSKFLKAKVIKPILGE